MTQASGSIHSSLSPAEIRTVIIGLMLAILLSALDQTIVSVSLPMMSAELQGFDLLAWVVSGYLVAVAVATPIYGKLGDLYGRRSMLSLAIGVFVVTSAGCALARSMPMLVGARILQGLGGGGLIAISQAIIADVVSPRDRGRYQGYVSGVYAVASVSGPLAGGLLTQYLSWRWVFWINLPLGLAAFFISRRALAGLPVPQVKRSIDYIGAVLLSIGLSTLLIGITRVGQGLSWLASSNLLLFGVALVALGAFLWQERRASEPIIPLMLFQYRTVVISFMILFVAFFQIVSLSVLIPLRLQMLTEAGADGSALQLIPLTLAIPFGAYIGGGMTVRSGRFKRIQIAGAAIVPAAVLFLGLIDAHAVFAGMACMLLAGFGLGLQLPTSMVALQNAVPHRHVGIATAVAAFVRSLGAAIGVAVLMATLLALLGENASAGAPSGADIIKAMVSHGLASRTPDHAHLTATAQTAFQTVLTTSAVIALLSLALAVLIPDDVLGEQVPS